MCGGGLFCFCDFGILDTYEAIRHNKRNKRKKTHSSFGDCRFLFCGGMGDNSRWHGNVCLCAHSIRHTNKRTDVGVYFY